MTSHQIISGGGGGQQNQRKPSSQLHLLFKFRDRQSSSRLAEEEMGTDVGGFLNIYSHYVLPYSWQAVTGMAVNVALINRWRV